MIRGAAEGKCLWVSLGKTYSPPRLNISNGLNVNIKWNSKNLPLVKFLVLQSTFTS